MATSLRATDPLRCLNYRRAAWLQLRSESRAAGTGDSWRYTADILYLLENPSIREAFFPVGSQRLAVEPARAQDGPAILAISEAHETPSAQAILERWWELAPQAFHVVRDETETPAGFYVLAEQKSAPSSLPDADPLARNWRRHLREHPVPESQTVVYLRRWLSATAGEMPSPVQAACWLDVKRSYMQCNCGRACGDAIFRCLTWKPMGRRRNGWDSRSSMGCRSHWEASPITWRCSISARSRWMAGWLSAWARNWVSNRAAFSTWRRENWCLTGSGSDLLHWEFGLLRYLSQREGVAVSRAELLEQVWGYKQSSGSNVVDVAVRAVRRKLGGRASMISTVPGIGYRFRESE